MTDKQIKRYKTAAILGGVLGITSLSFFTNHDPMNLLGLSFLSFLSYIPMYRELKKGVDERTEENLAKSNRVYGRVALLALILIGYIPCLLSKYFNIVLASQYFVGAVAIGFSCAVLAKVGSFFYFERK